MVPSFAVLIEKGEWLKLWKKSWEIMNLGLAEIVEKVWGNSACPLEKLRAVELLKSHTEKIMRGTYFLCTAHIFDALRIFFRPHTYFIMYFFLRGFFAHILLCNFSTCFCNFQF